ncbi:MAG: cupredoxin domain-containing protein, partial [Actinomycetota bacterium]
LAGHFGGGPPVLVIEVGGPGLDAPGDSLLLFPGESISASVSAPAGSTLFYLCAIHPWMQGSITVG